MMSEKTTFARAVKMAESGSFDGNYGAVRGLVRGSARLLGAYGVASDEWSQIAEDAGLPGARWRDPKAQDVVAQATFDRLYAKYGDWRLVAVAWKGGEALADAVAVDPRIIEDRALAPLKGYASQVMRYASEDIKVNQPRNRDGSAISANRFPISTDLAPADQVGVNTGVRTAEDSLREMLTMARNAQRRRAAGEAEVGDARMAGGQERREQDQPIFPDATAAQITSSVPDPRARTLLEQLKEVLFPTRVGLSDLSSADVGGPGQVIDRREQTEKPPSPSAASASPNRPT